MLWPVFQGNNSSTQLKYSKIDFFYLLTKLVLFCNSNLLEKGLTVAKQWQNDMFEISLIEIN